MERDKLEEHWKKKQCWLETVHLEQIFYRDVNSLEKISNAQEVRLVCLFKNGKRCKVVMPLLVKASAVCPQILLKNSSLGDTVDETEGLIKRHEAFEKLLGSQEDKVSYFSFHHLVIGSAYLC